MSINLAPAKITLRSPIEFVLLCVVESEGDRVVARSVNADIELIALAYEQPPLFFSSQRPKTFWAFFYRELLSFTRERHIQIASSYPSRLPSNETRATRVKLVWKGFATTENEVTIEKELSRHAADIKEASSRNDCDKLELIVSAVIYQCLIADRQTSRFRFPYMLFAILYVLGSLAYGAYRTFALKL